MQEQNSTLLKKEVGSAHERRWQDFVRGPSLGLRSADREHLFNTSSQGMGVYWLPIFIRYSFKMLGCLRELQVQAFRLRSTIGS